MTTTDPEVRALMHAINTVIDRLLNERQTLIDLALDGAAVCGALEDEPSRAWARHALNTIVRVNMQWGGALERIPHGRG